MTQKFKDFLSSSKFFLLKNALKVTLLYLFNVFILFSIVAYIKLNLKLKVDSKMCTFKTWKKFGKSRKYFEKTSNNPVTNTGLMNELTISWLSLTRLG